MFHSKKLTSGFAGIALLLLATIVWGQVFIPVSYWHVSTNSTAVAVNECPLTAQGSLSITVNYGGADATACTFIGANGGAMTGTGSCSCSAGACTVTGLTFLNAFLATMTPGSDFSLQDAFDYSLTRPSGTYILAQPLTITHGTWGPTCIGSNLLMWLDSTDATTVYQDTAGLTPAGNGNTVGLWKDKSGYGADSSQATAANRPTYNTGVNTYINFSTNWSSTFNYMNSLLSMSGASGFNGAVGSMFAMVNPTSTGGNSYISIMGFRQTGGDFTGFSTPAATSYGMDWYTNSIYLWNTGATITTGSNTIVGWTSTNGAQTVAVNGTTYTNAGATTSIPSRATTLTIANDNCCGNSRYFNGKIYELLVVKLNLTTALRQQIEGYIASKYSLTANLPAGHPYKTFAP
ncbi:MAG: hypothetical protein ACXVAX_09110 [Pseudobdellovibrio sp.]